LGKSKKDESLLSWPRAFTPQYGKGRSEREATEKKEKKLLGKTIHVELFLSPKEKGASQNPQKKCF